MVVLQRTVEGNMKQKRLTDEDILNTYLSLKSPRYKSTLALALNVPLTSLHRRLKSMNLIFDTPDNLLKGRGLNKIPLNEILEGKHPTYQTLKLKKRLVSCGILEYKCLQCGISEWNNITIELHLDHIDGDCHNHMLSNLRLLCPNCHSQTETYCGKNKICSSV